MPESRLINSVLPPVTVLFSTWLSLCHMLVFNAFLTVHTTFCFLCIFLLCLCFCVFYVLFALYVNGPLWTDFQINEMEYWGSQYVGGNLFDFLEFALVQKN